MATTKKRMFQIEVEGEIHSGGWLDIPRNNIHKVVDVNVYCYGCGNIWARLKYDLPDQREQFLVHCRCGNCGGTGLLHPLFMHDNVKINMPLGIMKRDFLICMEKKIRWSPEHDLTRIPHPVIKIGCNWWPRLECEWGYLEKDKEG